jgi:hypothetical protein
MERMLFLWDDLDDTLGYLRHRFLTLWVQLTGTAFR